jgi:hypothetical protein
MMSRRTQGTIGLDGVPPNANATFPKHVDEKCRTRRAVTIDRILNEDEKFRVRRAVSIDRILNEAKDVQVHGSADTNSSMPNYGQDDDADDDQPHVKGLSGIRHLVKVMIGTKSTTSSTAKGGYPQRGDMTMKGTTTVKKMEEKRDHRGGKDEEYQLYNPEDLQSRRKKSTSLLERFSGAKQQQAAPPAILGGLYDDDKAHSLTVVLPQTIHPQHGAGALFRGSWDLR